MLSFAQLRAAITDLLLRTPAATEQRRLLIPAAAGLVLEVGIGSGLNLRYYTPRVTAAWGVDPSVELLALAARRSLAAALPVRLSRAEAERLPFDDGAFDCVVMTWVLCSVRDPRLALEEARRVTRPGGRLLFVEHGRSPQATVRAWQDRLTPCWRLVTGGCHLDRPTADLIARAGWKIEQIERGYLRGPRLFSYHVRGSAVNASAPSMIPPDVQVAPRPTDHIS